MGVEVIIYFTIDLVENFIEWVNFGILFLFLNSFKAVKYIFYFMCIKFLLTRELIFRTITFVLKTPIFMISPYCATGAKISHAQYNNYFFILSAPLWGNSSLCTTTFAIPKEWLYVIVFILATCHFWKKKHLPITKAPSTCPISIRGLILSPTSSMISTWSISFWPVKISTSTSVAHKPYISYGLIPGSTLE